MVRVFIRNFCLAAMRGRVRLLGPAARCPAGKKPPKPESQSAKPPSDAKTMTITGCVRPGAAADSFVLAESSAAAAPAPAPGAAPAAKPAGTTGATKSYALVAKAGDDLSKHVNHKIEVTGTVSAAPPASSASPAAATQPKEALNVQSIKMVAANCQ